MINPFGSAGTAENDKPEDKEHEQTEDTVRKLEEDEADVVNFDPADQSTYDDPDSDFARRQAAKHTRLGPNYAKDKAAVRMAREATAKEEDEVKTGQGFITSQIPNIEAAKEDSE